MREGIYAGCRGAVFEGAHIELRLSPPRPVVPTRRGGCAQVARKLADPPEAFPFGQLRPMRESPVYPTPPLDPRSSSPSLAS